MSTFSAHQVRQKRWAWGLFLHWGPFTLTSFATSERPPAEIPPVPHWLHFQGQKLCPCFIFSRWYQPVLVPAGRPIQTDPLALLPIMLSLSCSILPCMSCTDTQVLHCFGKILAQARFDLVWEMTGEFTKTDLHPSQCFLALENGSVVQVIWHWHGQIFIAGNFNPCASGCDTKALTKIKWAEAVKVLHYSRFTFNSAHWVIALFQHLSSSILVLIPNAQKQKAPKPLIHQNDHICCFSPVQLLKTTKFGWQEVKWFSLFSACPLCQQSTIIETPFRGPNDITSIPYANISSGIHYAAREISTSRAEQGPLTLTANLLYSIFSLTRWVAH